MSLQKLLHNQYSPPVEKKTSFIKICHCDFSKLIIALKPKSDLPCNALTRFERGSSREPDQKCNITYQIINSNSPLKVVE